MNGEYLDEEVRKKNEGELLRCPHCGGRARLESIPYREGHRIMCRGCGAFMRKFDEFPKMRDAWNLRAPEPMTSAGSIEIHRLLDRIKEQSEEITRLKKPEPVTSVVRWTRYDGTPETLPEEGVAFLLVCNGLLLRQSYSFHPGAGQYEVVGDILPSPRNFKVGDLWAYLPLPPEGAE